MLIEKIKREEIIFLILFNLNKISKKNFVIILYYIINIMFLSLFIYYYFFLLLGLINLLLLIICIRTYFYNYCFVIFLIR